MISKKYFQSNIVFGLIMSLLVITAFFYEPPLQVIQGYWRIISSTGLLISDFLEIGGLSATLLNVVSVVFLYFLILKKLDIKITGPNFAGILTIAGFSFFGKTLLNTIPILSGIWLYTLYHKIPLRNVIIIILFSTGISPIVSFTIFGSSLPYSISIPLGLFAGLFTGFIIPPLAAHTVKFHNGYDLYNIGFAMGILALIYTAIYKAFNIFVIPTYIVSNEYHWFFFITLSVFSLGFILIAFLIDRDVLSKYPEILEKSGRLVTDFVRDVGFSPTVLNIGIMGLLSLTIVVLLKIQINGAVIGGILTVMGFSAFGKHPKKSLPIMFGVMISAYISHYSLDNAGVVIAIFFGTALSPISGKYGILAGIIAGFVHFFVVQATSMFQGGLDLYNNGFAAGFVAAVLVPILDSFKKESI